MCEVVVCWGGVVGLWFCFGVYVVVWVVVFG